MDKEIAQNIMAQNTENILLYDGTCGFCHYSVNFIFLHEKKSKRPIKFASLQSDFAKNILEAQHLQYMDSIVFLENGQAYTKSAAAMKLCTHLKWPWSWLRFASILPTSLLDILYDFIAKYRKKIAGDKDECTLPNKEMRERMIW
jgi:predicted DCC family thiol-disulfide oxidoreductase YuxK